jgi:uncharacterized protein involved in tellurium resistance
MVDYKLEKDSINLEMRSFLDKANKNEITAEQAKEKEKEFIALYGRVDLKSGCLVNLTDGGDGVLNMSSNSELRIKLSKAAIGKKMSESAKKKIRGNFMMIKPMNFLVLPKKRRKPSIPCLIVYIFFF